MKKIIALFLVNIIPMGIFADATEDLFEGSLKRNTEKTRTGLRNGGDVFAKDKYARTRIHYAANNCDLNIMPLLLEKVKKPTEEHKNLLSEALVAVAPGNPYDGLHFSFCKESQKNIIVAIKMLLQAGANVNHKSDNSTILYNMVLLNQLEVVKFLVANKADVNLVYDFGGGRITNVLIRAADKKPGILEILLKAGADPNAVLKSGITPLIVAARRNDLTENVKALIKYRANLNAKDSDGWTALNYAENNKNPEIVALLKKAGAKASPRPKIIAAKNTDGSPTPSAPRICLAFDATGALTCRDLPGSSCPGNRFWAGPGPCSSYNNKTVQQLSKSQWGSLISAFNGEAEDRNKVDEPKRESKEKRCQKACREQKCGSRMSGEYTASASAGLRCAGFCDQECSTNPGKYR